MTGLQTLTGEVRCDEEEGGAKKGEADAQGPLGLDLRHDACSYCGVLDLCRARNEAQGLHRHSCTRCACVSSDMGTSKAGYESQRAHLPERGPTCGQGPRVIKACIWKHLEPLQGPARSKPEGKTGVDPRTHGGRRTDSCRLSSDLHMYSVVQAHMRERKRKEGGQRWRWGGEKPHGIAYLSRTR